MGKWLRQMLATRAMTPWQKSRRALVKLLLLSSQTHYQQAQNENIDDIQRCVPLLYRDRVILERG
jgi:hypothetical protein